MTLCAFVITFNRPATLEQTLQSLLAQSRAPDSILVVDNSSNSDVASLVRQFADRGVSYHAMGYNAGPAGAASFALEQLSETGCDWIYWGDDDDPPRTNDTLERLLQLAANCDVDVAGVGAVGAMWNWRTGRVERLPDSALSGPIPVDVIAGGNQFLLRGSAVRSVGYPDKRLFFGFEEYEYCLRLRSKHSLQVDGDLMHEYRQHAGRLNLSKRRSVAPAGTIASLWRRYYGTRNYVFAMHNTFGRPDLARNEVKRAAGRSLTGWSKGPQFGYKMAKSQWMAVRDAYRGRMGCTVLPPAAANLPDGVGTVL